MASRSSLYVPIKETISTKLSPPPSTSTEIVVCPRIGGLNKISNRLTHPDHSLPAKLKYQPYLLQGVKPHHSISLTIPSRNMKYQPPSPNSRSRPPPPIRMSSPFPPNKISLLSFIMAGNKLTTAIFVRHHNDISSHQNIISISPKIISRPSLPTKRSLPLFPFRKSFSVPPNICHCHYCQTAGHCHQTHTKLKPLCPLKRIFPDFVPNILLSGASRDRATTAELSPPLIV